jgi:hypothetical protein
MWVCKSALYDSFLRDEFKNIGGIFHLPELCRFFILYNFIHKVIIGDSYGQINIFNASTLSLINSFMASPKAQGYPI